MAAERAGTASKRAKRGPLLDFSQHRLSLSDTHNALQWRQLTKILNVLVRSHGERACWLLAALSARAVAFENHNAIGNSSGHKSCAVAEQGPFAVVLERDVAQAVANGGQKKRNVSNEPCKLESLRNAHEALLEGLARGGGRWGHGESGGGV